MSNAVERPSVLIVDDHDPQREYMVATVRKFGFWVLQTDNLPGASDFIDTNRDLFGIVLDGCVPGAIPNTIPLIKRTLSLELPSLRAIIAVSNEAKHRKTMHAAGCTHETPKNRVASLLHEIRQTEITSS